jgi:hypothetical protein
MLSIEIVCGATLTQAASRSAGAKALSERKIVITFELSAANECAW